MTQSTCPLLLAILILSSADARDPWWPQFRGPDSAGVGEGRPPAEFGPDRNLIWKTEVGPGVSSPIVYSQHIFLTEFDRANKQLATVCLDSRTGKLRWRRAVTAPEIEKVYEISSPAAPTPATDGEN